MSQDSNSKGFEPNEPVETSRVARIVRDFLHPEHLELLITAMSRARESTDERVRAAQQIRDLNRLPAEAGFHLVALAIDDIVGTRSFETFERDHGDHFRRVCELHGLDPESSLESGPPDYMELRKQMEDIERRAYTDAFREFGETEMAELRDADRNEFDRRMEVGRRLFFGKQV